jgi:hypothetical protein
MVLQATEVDDPVLSSVFHADGSIKRDAVLQAQQRRKAFSKGGRSTRKPRKVRLQQPADDLTGV